MNQPAKRGRKPKQPIEVKQDEIIEDTTTSTGGRVKTCHACKKANDNRNKSLFPHLYKEVRDITEEEVELMKRINDNKTIVNDDVNGLFKLYNSVFGTNVTRCNCPGLVRTFIERINDRYEI
jgi:hypothetical protein